jgi:integrase
MSVTVRPYRRGGWEVDIVFRLPSGETYRERKKAPISSKSAAQRWGQDRERHLLQHGPAEPKTKKEVPTLNDFAPRFLEGASANRQKASTLAAKRSILTNHLLPYVGAKRLDAVTAEDVASLKYRLRARSPKTVNNVLTVWSAAYATAVGLGVIERRPCAIPLLRVSKTSAAFHDFADYARLVEAARQDSTLAVVVVLLGGDAGLRCGEILALEWSDVDLSRRQLTVARSDWHGHVAGTKSGRVRHIPLTTQLAGALQAHRHLSGPRVACQSDGRPLTQIIVYGTVRRATRRAGLTRYGVHMLRHTFCSHLAMRGAPARAIQELAGHQDLGTTQRYMHLSPAAIASAIRLLDGDRRETAIGENAKGSV